MSLLKNAATSIKLGMEDFRLAQTDEARALSAIRNMTAGILLLFKFKLVLLSPDSDGILIKADLKPVPGPDGLMIWKAKSSKTVDTQTLIQRLKDFGVTDIDWQRLLDLIKVRNDIEHYFSSSPTSALLKVMSDSFHLIQQFSIKHLEIFPIQLLGQEVWGFLTDQKAFYDREFASCQEDLHKVDWKSPTLVAAIPQMACTDCQSKLIRPGVVGAPVFETDFICTRCSTRMTYDLVVEEVLGKVFFSEQYEALTRGGDTPLEGCSECYRPTFIVADNRCGACHVVGSGIGQ